MNVIALLKQPEGKTLEFKRDLSSPIGIVRTLIAFANTAGGTLAIGIEDKTHHIIGVPDPLLQEEKITNLVNDLIAPLILPEIEILPYKQTQIMVVHIYPSSVRPHFLKNKGLENGTYVRVGSSNRLADMTLIQELKRFANNQSYDEQPFARLGGESIDFKVVSGFFAPFRALKQHDLKTLRIVVEHQGKIVPTVAGLLLFGKNRNEYFPDAWIQAGRFFGMDKSKIIDSVEIHSYPVMAIEEAIAFVQKHATLALEMDSAKRTERWNIPFKAVREAIINAVTHADYSQLGSPIRLSIFQDRLEIENPGLLPFGLTIEDISGGVSKLRNRIIGRVFNELKLVERWGSGIQRIISACEENGLEKPIFEEIGIHFRVTIYTLKKRELLLDNRDQSILNLLREYNGLSTQDISKKIKLSPRATRTRLASLYERGMIIQVGSGPKDPTKRFFIKENEAMLISESEFEDYRRILKDQNYAENDFDISEADETQHVGNSISPIITKVTINCKKTGKRKAYKAGHMSNWLSEFEMDLSNGFFN